MSDLASPRPKPLGGLSQMTRHITTHNDEGKAVVHSSEDLQWVPVDDSQMGFATLYTTSSMPTDMNNNADLRAHDDTMSSGKLGLVNPNGTVIRVVDFAPGYACDMHRTKSLDYGIVMEGEVEMELDAGDKRLLKKGDVAIQRGTYHLWRNVSTNDWARMIFVLQDCKQLEVNGKVTAEDLGSSANLPASGN